jgi:hypothetical protein
MNNRGEFASGEPAPPTTREWVRSLVIVIALAVVLTIGGLLLAALLLGGCGTAAYCS